MARRMLLRKARPGDLDDLFEVRQSVNENRLFEPHDEFLRIAGPVVAAGLCWVCEDVGGRLLGFGASDPSDGQIDVLYVRPEAEGKGIGRALLRKCCDDLLIRGHRTAWLTTSVGTRAEGFYRRLGWRMVTSDRPGEVMFRRSLLK